jgi:hypothetical protein
MDLHLTWHQKQNSYIKNSKLTPHCYFFSNNNLPDKLIAAQLFFVVRELRELKAVLQLFENGKPFKVALYGQTPI